AAPVLAYDELIESEAPLAAALEALYGDGVPCPSYLDDEFRAVRDANLARRETVRHRRLADLARRIEDEEREARAGAGATTSAPGRGADGGGGRGTPGGRGRGRRLGRAAAARRRGSAGRSC